MKTLPASAYLVGALDAGIHKYGAGNFTVMITYTHDQPTKKGNPQKIFDVEVLSVDSSDQLELGGLEDGKAEGNAAD